MILGLVVQNDSTKDLNQYFFFGGGGGVTFNINLISIIPYLISIPFILRKIYTLLLLKTGNSLKM